MLNRWKYLVILLYALWVTLWVFYITRKSDQLPVVKPGMVATGQHNTYCFVGNGSGQIQVDWSGNTQCLVVSCNKRYVLENNRCNLNKSLDPRAYIDYIRDLWELWVDYFVLKPSPQPLFDGKSKEENNAILFDYLRRQKSEIKVPADAKGGYIMFVLERPLMNDYDIFFGIDGKSQWPLIKSKTLARSNNNEYLYLLTGLAIAGRDPYPNMIQMAKWNNIFIWWVLEGNGNSITEVVIAFTK